MPKNARPTAINRVPRTLNGFPPHRSAKGPVKRIPPTSPANVMALMRPSCSSVSPALPPSSTRTGGTTTRFGTGVKLLEETSEAQIGLPGILRVGSVHKLVAVVVHLHPAVRANHLVSLGHSSHTCLRVSVKRYLRTTLA